MTEEQKEQKYLDNFLSRVEEAIVEINKTIKLKKDEIDYMHNHMQEHKRDMDHLEKNAMRETINNYSLQGEHSVEKKKRLFRMLNVPYFGRIDFEKKSAEKPQPIYIGIHNFQDDKTQKNLVYDWRAPISGLFYDYELGEASYDTSRGKQEGEIVLKRQFRIRKGIMEYMIDSDVTIHDDILQKELKQASSGKMRNIVASIQREQNKIIRNEDARNLIIQGVAGSGKTSVALHRIAFLLYKYKDTISSDDILIISPNKIFASYISNVLPELGEETVKEISMEEIADELFDHKLNFESFFHQVSRLLSKKDDDLIERIKFKSSADMLRKIDEYIIYLENKGFKPIDIIIDKKPVPEWFIKELFQKYNRMPILQRFNEVVNEIVKNVSLYYQYDIQGKERTELHSTIRKMFPSTNLRVLYKGFFEWLEKPEMLKLSKGSTYEYSDIYPLLYLKMKLEGLKPFSKVKHLVIDEMQDHSPVQYEVLNTLFTCKKTILGDINQSVNPFSSSDIESVSSVFPEATCMLMQKSYRSTCEITNFSSKIKNVQIEAIERHGDEPAIYSFKNKDEEFIQISNFVEKFQKGDHNSLGIICKTQTQANSLYEALQDRFDVKLLDEYSTFFDSGIIITTAYLAKGLEFDEVVVPFCNDGNYKNEFDRQMLYIACTRAMHELNITYTGKISSFLL